MPIDHPISSDQHGRRPDPCAASPSLPRSCSLRGGRSAGADRRPDHRRRPGRERRPAPPGGPGRRPGQGHRQQAGRRAAAPGGPARPGPAVGHLRRRRQDGPGHHLAGREPPGGRPSRTSPSGSATPSSRSRTTASSSTTVSTSGASPGRPSPTCARADRPGRQHPHPAAGQADHHRQLADPRPQAARGHVRGRAGAALQQERDPPVLPEPGLLRRGRLRHRHRGPALLRQQVDQVRDPGGGGVAGGDHRRPRALQADRQEGQRGPAQPGPGPDAGARLRLRQGGGQGQEGEAQGQAVHARPAASRTSRPTSSTSC